MNMSEVMTALFSIGTSLEFSFGHFEFNPNKAGLFKGSFFWWVSI